MQMMVILCAQQVPFRNMWQSTKKALKKFFNKNNSILRLTEPLKIHKRSPIPLYYKNAIKPKNPQSKCICYD